jgi:hypothetical protein
MKRIALRFVLISAVILLGGCGSSSRTSSSESNDDSGYTTEVEDAFISSCTDEGGSNDQCLCVFNYVASTIPFDEFVKMENELNSGAPASDYAQIVKDAVDSCT